MSTIPAAPYGDPQEMLLHSNVPQSSAYGGSYYEMLTQLGRHLEDLGSILVAHSVVKGAALDLVVTPSGTCCKMRCVSPCWQSSATTIPPWMQHSSARTSSHKSLEPKALEAAQQELQERLRSLREQIQTGSLVGQMRSPGPPPPSPWLSDPAVGGREESEQQANGKAVPRRITRFEDEDEAAPAFNGQSQSPGRRAYASTMTGSSSLGKARFRSIIGSRLQDLDKFVASEIDQLSSGMKNLQEENSNLREQLLSCGLVPKVQQCVVASTSTAMDVEAQSSIVPLLSRSSAKKGALKPIEDAKPRAVSVVLDSPKNDSDADETLVDAAGAKQETEIDRGDSYQRFPSRVASCIIASQGPVSSETGNEEDVVDMDEDADIERTGTSGSEIERIGTGSAFLSRRLSDSMENLEESQYMRHARKFESQYRCFSELQVWNLSKWEVRSTSSRMVSTVNSIATSAAGIDKNFKKIVRELENQERRAEIARKKNVVAACLQPYIMSPMSGLSVFLDHFAAALIVYDCLAVPLLLLQATEAKEHSLMSLMFWVSRIYWTLSIPRVFLTGYIREDGEVELNVVHIAKEYRNTWLTLDLIIVISDWVDATAGGVVRILRMLKATRLARVVRIPNMIMRKLKAGSSEIMLLWLKIVKDTILFFLLNHFLACMWFYVGTLSGDDGWVAKVGVSDANLIEKYCFVLHWSASQFIGSTEVMPKCEVERGFGALVMIFAFIWSASFISGITAAMTRLQMLTGQKSMLFSSLNKFLANHKISEQLGMRVLASAKFLFAEKERNQAEADIELLQMLSEPMLIEIHYEVHSNVLTQHPFFWRYNHYEPLAIQKLCHSAITILSLAVGDVLFSQGEEPTDPRMFFPISGTLLYIKDYDGDGNIELDEMVQVTNGMWVCEPVLWMKWTHTGNLRAASHCSVLALSAERFGSIISEYRSTTYPAQYASELVSTLNFAFGQDEVDDLCQGIDIKEIVDRIFPHLLSKNHGIFSGSFARSQSKLLNRSHSNLDLSKKFNLRKSQSNLSALFKKKSNTPSQFHRKRTLSI